MPPPRPITLVIPFPARGAIDALGRVVSKQLGVELGQAVVVEDRAGAATAIGEGYVRRRPPAATASQSIPLSKPTCRMTPSKASILSAS